MLCNKISENPRKGFLQLLDRGMNKVKKQIYFRTPSHSSLLLPSVMEFFTKRAFFWATLLYMYVMLWRVLRISYRSETLSNLDVVSVRLYPIRSNFRLISLRHSEEACTCCRFQEGLAGLSVFIIRVPTSTHQHMVYKKHFWRIYFSVMKESISCMRN